MRKKLLSLIIIVFCFNSKAQVTFPAKGADWHFMVYSNGFGGGPAYYTSTEMKYTHDTLINGRTAAIINNISYFSNPFQAGGTSYFYSSNDSVFFYNSCTLSSWQLLYSYNTPVGQSWQFTVNGGSYDTTSFTWVVTVDSVKKIVINGDTLKKIAVTYSGSPTYSPQSYPAYAYRSSIVERLGDLTGLLNILELDIVGICDGCPSLSGLLCYKDSTFNLYQPDTTKPCNYSTEGIKQFISNKEQVTVYPNPTTGMLNVEGLLLSDNISICDVLGNAVNIPLAPFKGGIATLDVSSLQSGVYFIKTTQGTAKFIKQ